MTYVTRHQKDIELDAAFERLSVLVRSNASWDDSYAHRLGASIRKDVENQPENIIARIYGILEELGFRAALSGFIGEPYRREKNGLASDIEALKVIAKHYLDTSKQSRSANNTPVFIPALEYPFEGLEEVNDALDRVNSA